MPTGAHERGRLRLIAPLLRASHFPPSLAVTAFTTALAARTGTPRQAARVGAAVLCGQLAVGWTNDFLDRDDDIAAARADKPIAAGEVPPTLVRNCAVAATVLSVPLSLRFGGRAGLVHLAAVGSGLAYDAGLKRSALSVLPYVSAFGAFPAFVAMAVAPDRRPSIVPSVAGALLGAGAHFVNVVPDIASDVEAGILGLPQRLGSSNSILAGAALMAASAAVVATSNGRAGVLAKACLAANAAALSAVVITQRLGRERLAWKLALATAGTTVALHLTGER